MRISGTLRTVLVDGYDRCLEVLVQGQAESLWVAALETDQYARSGDPSHQFQEGAPVEMEVFVQYVSTVEARDEKATLGLAQPLKSSHTSVVGRVIERISSDRFVCSISQEGDSLAVELERPVHVSIGQIVGFTGELSHVG
jgi:hypothetical protein